MLKYLSANAKKSLGRLYYEKDKENYRSPFQRDRDRVIHSNAFRKLKHKTQVFIESESDYYRTRLTHTLEVSQIARSLCKALSLNEELGEVVSLAHDLGHPPFGHNGEKSLNNCMKNFGGFNHNDQTLRVITLLEKRHPEFDGLNLTWESLEGIVKHNGIIINNIPFHIKNFNKNFNLSLNLSPLLESQVASIADDVAYNNHDIEDALRAKLINFDLLKEIDYFNKIINKLENDYKNIDDARLTYQILRVSISKMVNDIINQSLKNIKKNNIKKIVDIQKNKNFLISMSKKMKNNCDIIKEFLFVNVYNHKKLRKKRENVENITVKLFNFFEKNFDQLPNDWINQEKNYEKNRIICDYISGMTDRYAIKLYKSIYE
tara:strand:- start:943 stop:2070 length:1128 start_codon:yes stop_codon:yes gene_type:complete